MTIPSSPALVSGGSVPRMGRPASAERAARAAAAAPATRARGSAKREDKDSLTVASPAVSRRLAGEGEDRDPAAFLIFPPSTTPRAAHAGGSGGSGGASRFDLLILDDVKIAAAPAKGFAESDRDAWAEGVG